MVGISQNGVIGTRQQNGTAVIVRGCGILIRMLLVPGQHFVPKIIRLAKGRVVSRVTRIGQFGIHVCETL